MTSCAKVRIEPLGPSDHPALEALLAESDVRAAFAMDSGNLFEFLILLRRCRCRRSGVSLTFAVVAAQGPGAGEDLVGLCCLVPAPGGEAELAFALGARARGRGLMGPALRAFMADVPARHAIASITATVDRTNVASRAVLRRLGFVEVGAGRFLRDGCSPHAGEKGLSGCGPAG